MGRSLFIWVEGASDARFFESVIRPFFDGLYGKIEVRTYANLKREKFRQILLSIDSLDADYIVVADIDQEPCVTSKKAYVRTRIGEDIGSERIRWSSRRSKAGTLPVWMKKVHANWGSRPSTGPTPSQKSTLSP